MCSRRSLASFLVALLTSFVKNSYQLFFAPHPLWPHTNLIQKIEKHQPKSWCFLAQAWKRGMLLEVRFVKAVPLWCKFKPTSPRDADTANTLFLVIYSAAAVCELPVSQSEREFVPSDCDIKINTIHEGWCSFLWRRKRDSNPRAFWANGFQDRLVVTASIFLRINEKVINSKVDCKSTLPLKNNSA